jgi:glutathione S-transferase
MKIYNNHLGNFFTHIAVITSKFAGVQLDVTTLTDEEQKSKEYKQKCLTGKFPCLETNEGHLFESAAIARYIARIHPDSGLVGGNAYENAQVD